MEMKPRVQTHRWQHSAWLPPLASVTTLVALFASAMAIRHSPLAETGRPVMIALSTIAAITIAIFGALMIVRRRARGIAHIIAGLLMIVIGLYTFNHVLS